ATNARSHRSRKSRGGRARASRDCLSCCANHHADHGGEGTNGNGQSTELVPISKILHYGPHSLCDQSLGCQSACPRSIPSREPRQSHTHSLPITPVQHQKLTL